MNRLKKLYETTVELQRLSDADVPANEREATIKRITDFIETREQQLTAVKPPYTEEEKALGRELLAMDKAVNEKLAALFADVKHDLRTVKKQKSSNLKYANPYQQAVNYDGMFLDHKQ